MEDEEISACAKVFGTAELADQILLDLSPADILCGAQQVCRQWRHVVAKSDPVQEHLFMKPICNKRLNSHHSSYAPSSWTDTENRDLPRTVLENPFLILLSHEDILANDEAFTRPEASWRKMLITQPAVKEVLCCTNRYVVDPENNAGVTFDDIFYRLQGEFLINIDYWSLWTAYKHPQQLKEAKIAMRSEEQAREENIEQGEDDDLWWMPDEYLYGI